MAEDYCGCRAAETPAGLEGRCGVDVCMDDCCLTGYIGREVGNVLYDSYCAVGRRAKA